ncbi:MAG: hypothetical protein U0Q16_08100 [Bryobacteraceae bacterium]
MPHPDEARYEQTAQEWTRQRETEMSYVGLLILLISITVFFSSLVVVFILRGLEEEAAWRTVPIPPMVWVSTTLIVISSVLLHMGNRLWGNRLGWAFLVAQIAAWFQIVSTRGPGSWFFWTFSGLHALHVLGGLFGFRWARFESSRIYWHFLTGMWVFIMTMFLVLRNW